MAIKIGDYLYSNIYSYKVKLRIDETRTKTIWASDKTVSKNGFSITYTECKQDGSEFWKGNIKQVRLYVGLKSDIIWEKKARMNLRYGLLEVVEK